jgi:hypothetical protein
MSKMVLSIAAFALMTSVSVAQDRPSGAEPQNKAVKGVHENNSSMPVRGANSFTRAEARKQIEARGYTHVAGLKKDKDGVWRGTAQKDGTTGPVSVDYQGNVN